MLFVDDPRFKPAMQLMDLGEFPAALEHLNALLGQVSPEERAVVLYWKAYCFIGLGEVIQARTSLDEAFMKVDTNAPLVICLKLASAILLGIEDGPENAAVQIKSLLDLYAYEFKQPDFSWEYAYAKACLGIYLLRSNNYSEAGAALEEALSLETRPLHRYIKRMYLGDSYYKLGDLNRARDQLEGALRELESIPAPEIPPDYKVQPRYELALIAYMQDHFDDAHGQLALVSDIAVQSPKLQKVIDRLKVLLEPGASS
jgi:tetratricopeptide (TPR) repeat protein